MKSKMKFLLSLAWWLLWMGLIFWYSSQDSVSSKSQSDSVAGIIGRIYIYITGGRISHGKEFMETLDHIVRKSAHFFLFFVLGFLTVNVSIYFKGLKHKILASIAFCVLFAISDELHQYFVPGRGALNKDVIIDSIASAGGTFFYKFINKY